jgi:hypothetical protein
MSNHPANSSTFMALKASFLYELTNHNPPKDVREYLLQRVEYLSSDFNGDFDEYIDAKRADAEVNMTSILLDRTSNVRSS